MGAGALGEQNVLRTTWTQTQTRHDKVYAAEATRCSPYMWGQGCTRDGRHRAIVSASCTSCSILENTMVQFAQPNRPKIDAGVDRVASYTEVLGNYGPEPRYSLR